MLLKMHNINKSFAGTQALKDVQFSLDRGEVRALMGENGAGKSTLMKILTGVYNKDSGEIYVDKELKDYENTKMAQDDGIVIVHQELNLMHELKVYENIFIGREFMKNKLIINDSLLIEKTKELFNELGVKIDPNARVSNLTVGEQQMVEIAKAISMRSKIIVFDEPTAALSTREIIELFKIIEDLKEKGVGIVYISHRMDEIEKISDSITVLRDGEYIGTVNTKETSQDEIIKMMVGRELQDTVKTHSNVDENAPVVFEVKNIKAGKMVKDVSFKLKKGEILGVSGLMGAGRTETMRAIFGADTLDNGRIYIHGDEVKINNTKDAVDLGIAYVSEDRRRYGVLVEETISDNIVLNNLDQDTNKIFINEKRSEERAEIYRNKLRIKSTDVNQKVRNLSGGNQQKVVIAKWLAKDSEIIIFDEPTRGIDIGAKTEIYELMNELVNDGKSIIMISSEMNEVLRMSDRIIVLCEGKTTGELSIEEASQEEIIRLATVR